MLAHKYGQLLDVFSCVSTSSYRDQVVHPSRKDAFSHTNLEAEHYAKLLCETVDKNSRIPILHFSGFFLLSSFFLMITFYCS